MADSEMMARLAAIEDRLSALERREGLASPSDAAPRSRSVAAPPTAPPPVPHAPPPPPPPPPPRGSSPESSAAEANHSTLAPSPTETPAPSPRPWDPPPRETPSAPTDSSTPAGIERFLGVQVAAWIGAIVVIAAIAIFAKFAIDQGWLQRTPPAVKLAFAYAISAALAIAGTLLRDRVGRLPSSALLAAGIGGLFVSTCAGITPLNVLGPMPALLAGIASAVIGGALTLRSRELAVGVISLLGAYVVPIFANIYLLAANSSGQPPIAGALYLTGIYAVALALASLGPPGFAWLRFAGVFQALSGFLLLIEAGRASPAVSLGFTALWWAMAVGECSLAAMRGRSPRLNTAFTVAATSIGATLALRGAFATNPWTDLHSWLPLAMAGAALAAALYLRSLAPAGGVDVRDREEDPEASTAAETAARQASVLAILAGALVLVQVGVVVRGGALPVTWSVMGAAAILIGRRMSQQPTAWLGVASAMLGLAATAFHAIVTAGAAVTIVEYPADSLGRETSAWAFRFADTHIAPLLVAFALLFAARFWSTGSDPARRAPITSGFLAACASLLWIGLSLAIGSGYAAVVLLLAIPVAALLGGRTLSLIKLIALLGSTIAALAWFVATTIHVSKHTGTVDARPTGGAIAAALVIGSFLLLGRRFRSERFSEVPTVIGFGFGLAALATLLLVEQLAGSSDRSITIATIWASLAVAIVGTIGAVSARKSGLELSEGLGLIAASLATSLILFATLVDAVKPSEGVTWIRHWLATPANAAVIGLALCALAIRGVLATSPTVRKGLLVEIGAVLLVSSSALVFRLFDPRVGAPFDTSDTLQQSALSVWLALLAVGFVIFGFRQHARAARWTGLVLLGVVAVKVLVLDMANAETIWRVAALLVTGLLLVATSAVYTRAARATSNGSSAPSSEPPPPTPPPQ